MKNCRARSKSVWVNPSSWSATGSKRFIAADKLTLQTNVDWIFAGGDMLSGPASVVEAVAHGHEAAESIDRFLRGADLAAGRQQPEPEPEPMPQRELLLRPRAVPKKLPVDQREGYAEIEQTLDESAAVTEAKRCLPCGLCSQRARRNSRHRLGR